LRIQYELRFRDYFWFNAIHQFLVVTYQIAFLVLGLLVFLGELSQRGAAGALVAALAAYVLAWLLQLAVNVLVLYSKKNKSLLTRHVVELQQEAFYEENPFSKSYHYWPGIAKVVARPGYQRACRTHHPQPSILRSRPTP